MAKLLIHIATGPENPTRAALRLLVARIALEDGHTVGLFLADDAAALLRPATLEAAHGIGTGSLREHVDVMAAGGSTCRDCRARPAGVTAGDLGGLEITMAPPSRLVELVFEADRVLTY